MRKKINEQLKAKRVEKGLSLRDVENISGLKNSNISSFETGNRDAQCSFAEKYAESLGCEITIIDKVTDNTIKDNS